MTKKFKVLSLLAIGSSMVIGAVALSVTGAFSNISNKFAKATGTEYSLAFSRSNEYSLDDSTFTYKFKKQTESGNDCYLITKGGRLIVSGALATIPSSGDGNTYSMPVLKFYKDADGTIPFRHQAISSIYIKTNGNVTLALQTSPNGVGFIKKADIAATSDGVTFSNFNENDRYIAITCETKPSNVRNIRNVEIAYECGESMDYSFSTGTYSLDVVDNYNHNSTLTFYFDQDGYGYYDFRNGLDDSHYNTLFKWDYSYDYGGIVLTYKTEAEALASGSCISGMKPTGNSTNYAGYRMYGYNGSGQVTVAYCLDNSLQFVFYTTNDWTKTRSTPTVVNKA